MWRKLEDKALEYQKFGITIMVQRDPYAVVIITPLMRRAHGLKSSSEIVFVDSTSSCYDGHHVMTFLFIKCSIGAVPI